MASLLELKAPTCHLDDRGETPLHWASRKDCDSCTSQILGAGAEPNIMSANGWTPLMLAARWNQLDIAAKLIAAGASVNVKGFHDWSPLHLARQYGHIEMASLLLDGGASEEHADNDGLITKRFDLSNKCWGVL